MTAKLQNVGLDAQPFDTFGLEVSGNDIFVPIPSHSQWFISIPIPRFSRELFPFPSHSHCLFPIPTPIPDYCNSVLAGLATLSITSLQRVQNAAASLVLNLDHWTHHDCAATVTLATSRDVKQ